MGERARDEDGQFVETITPERVLTVMRDADSAVLTAGDIAEELGCTPEAVTKKLQRLQKQDRVGRRQIGARAVIWWLTEQPSLDTGGEHDPKDPFFAVPPPDVEGGELIGVSDIDEVLGEVFDEDDTISNSDR